MNYTLTDRQGFGLFLLYACVATPAVPLLSKALALQGISPMALSVALLLFSGLPFMVVGDVHYALAGGASVYRRYLTDPAFYLLTGLMAVTILCFFKAITYLPAAVLASAVTISPAVLYALRHVYRPRELQGNVLVLTGLGFLTVYGTTFGWSLPSGSAETGLLWGIGWLVANIVVRCFYQFEREALANTTDGYWQSLRFAGLHRTASAACLLPFLSGGDYATLTTPDGAFVKLGALAVVGGISWLLGFHVIRTIGAYWTGYRHVFKAGMVALGEVVFIGIYLNPDQYASMVGLLVLAVLLYGQIATDS